MIAGETPAELDRLPAVPPVAPVAALVPEVAPYPLARSEFKLKLDFSSESIDALDEILVIVGESPELDLDFEVRLWGSYLGEVLRRRYAGSWEMTQYPGGLVAVPAIEVRSSRLFPLMKVHRRLTVGDEEDLRAFYSMVTERLGKAAQVN